MKAGDSQQPIRLVLGGLAAALAAGFAWFGLGQLGQRQAESAALIERMGQPALAAILADPGGIDRAKRETVEIQKLEKELMEKEGSPIAGWAMETAQLSGEGQSWSSDPGKWKDRLVAVQSELQQNAPTHRVQLASDFYLGLDPFRQKSPGAAEVPGLALHLSVAERLVQLLFRARKVPEQYPTPCEFRGLVGPGSVADQVPAGGPPGSRAPAGPERKTFRVEIRCSPEVLYEYVRLLSQDPALLILRDLKVSNEKQQFPLRSEIAKKFSAAETPSTGPTSKAKKLLEILAGEESLLATLELDFVAWRNPAEGKNQAAANPSP